MILHVTLCWDPPRDWPMWGIINHVSYPRIITVCITALKNIPDNVGLAPYLPNVIYRRDQLF